MNPQSFFKPITRFMRTYKLASVGGFIVIVFLLVGLLAPWVAPKDPNKISVWDSVKPPGGEFWLGADHNGRDLLSRIIFGARTTLGIALAAVLIAALSGSLLGIFSGYFGGAADNIIMRGTDVLFAFPSLILAIAVVAFLGPSDINVAIALGIVYAPILARVARSAALVVKNQLFIFELPSAKFTPVHTSTTTNTFSLILVCNEFRTKNMIRISES